MGVSAFGMLCVVFSVVALGVYIAAFASPEWVLKDNYIYLYNNVVPIDFSIKMGLFKACTTMPNIANFPDLTLVEDCTSDGAKDWQTISAGLAIASLVLSVLTSVLTFVNVFVTKIKGSLKIWYLVVASQFLTAGGITAILILYACNKLYNVEDVFTVQLKFGWGFYTGVASAPLVVLFMICIIVNIVKTMPIASLETKNPKTVAPEGINMYNRKI